MLSHWGSASLRAQIAAVIESHPRRINDLLDYWGLRMTPDILQLEGEELDFNALLVENPIATFAVRIAGESMTGAGIFPGDIAIVDRSKEPVNGCIVLAIVDGGFTIKRFHSRDGKITLHAENDAFPDIEIKDGMDFEVWGRVTSTIRNLIDIPDPQTKKTDKHKARRP